MNARLSHIEREVLERAIRLELGAGDWAETAPIVTVVEAILLARQLRAQSAGTPMPRLRAVPPSKISPSLRLLRDIGGNLPSTTIPPS